MHWIALLLGLLLTGVAAPAASQHKHAHPLKSQHGGEVVEGRRHHFELVLLPGATGRDAVDVSLYVTSHQNRPVKLERASASVVATAAGRESRFDLALAEGHVLKGAGTFAATPDLTFGVTITIGKLPPEKLVFRPLAPKR